MFTINNYAKAFQVEVSANGTVTKLHHDIFRHNIKKQFCKIYR